MILVRIAVLKLTTICCKLVVNARAQWLMSGPSANGPVAHLMGVGKDLNTDQDDAEPYENGAGYFIDDDQRS